jgi:hypothetical protein
MQGPQACNTGCSRLTNRTWRSHVRPELELDSSRSRCGRVGHEELNPADTLCPKLEHKWIRSPSIWTMSRRNPSSLDRYRLDLGIASSQCRGGETMSSRPPYPHPALASRLRHQPSPQHHLDRCSVHLQAPRQPTQPSPENSPPLPPLHDSCVPRARVTRRGPTIPLELTYLGRASSPPCRIHDRVKL